MMLQRKKMSYFEGKCRGYDEQRSRILTKYVGGTSNAVMVNPLLQLNEDGFSGEDHPYSYCFLKFCHLCHKPLSLDRQVYMYRGELGFCSVECRSRQMYLDEMKKIEISTRRILASFHQRRRDDGGLCELEDISGVYPSAAPPFFMFK